MDAAAARARFAAARVARLATVGADGRPHLVPMVFAVDGDTIYGAVDDKPKGTRRLRRLANIAANPHVALLADHYDDADWTALWWVRADGTAGLVEAEAPRAARARELLVARYPQYRDTPPAGTVIAVTVTRWSGWAAAG
jgi:PPOX class probable F420-dependent enzyme